ncbi:MAG: FitA-like ribbon-helix-helix domain-containing protein [Pseudomonadota bacterium]|jgi:plasmid stability protein
MPVNLSVKNVPDALAQRLRERARRNRRSLQRELLAILEEAAGECGAAPSGDAPAAGALTVTQVSERAAALFPGGTRSSIGYIRELRDGR